MVDPVTAGMLMSAAGTGVEAATQEKPDKHKLHTRWQDPYQGMLFQQMMKRGMSGAGDFGFGQAAKQGNSQLSQFMSDRGISPGSGYGLAGQGNMLAQAMGADVANRRQYGLNLLAAQPRKETSDYGWANYGSEGYSDAARGLRQDVRSPDTGALYDWARTDGSTLAGDQKKAFAGLRNRAFGNGNSGGG
jgi:hypothetical protein